MPSTTFPLRPVHCLQRVHVSAFFYCVRNSYGGVEALCVAGRVMSTAQGSQM